MGIRVDPQRAAKVLRAEADADASGVASPKEWLAHVRRVSVACEEANTRTHVAFLGTALLARATDLQASAYAVKRGDGSKGAYSARSLGHGVLVPLSPRLGIDLGVSGREPLNNQPYFRIERADLGTLLPIVRGRAEAAVRALVSALDALAAITSSAAARAALRAFVNVRREYARRYAPAPGGVLALSVAEFTDLVRDLVAQNSEGGKRAQAVVAGLLDVITGPGETVVMSRVNDPDRHFPGDVGVEHSIEPGATVTEQWARVLEVRDKRVEAADIDLFVQKCQRDGIARAAVVAIHQRQPAIDTESTIAFAASAGVFLTLFIGWPSLVREILFWGTTHPHAAVTRAHSRIRERLQEAEASSEALQIWDRPSRG